MNPLPPGRLKPIQLDVVAVLLLGCIVLFHLALGLADRPLIRASHLGTALEYAKGEINLLKPTIVGFNATGTPTALELPVWQGTAGFVFKLTGSTWYGWANVVALALFATCLWPLYELAKAYAPAVPPPPRGLVDAGLFPSPAPDHRHGG